jgi:hypothetical protein
VFPIRFLANDGAGLLVIFFPLHGFASIFTVHPGFLWRRIKRELINGVKEDRNGNFLFFNLIPKIAANCNG